MLALDHHSPVPLRAQVEALLRDLIREPQYQTGALLPDEVALAAQLGVSRGTIRSGISKLVFEGLLDRKAGVGTRVSNRNVESGIREWHSFTREMASKGVKVENFRVAYHQTEASKEALQALQLDGSRILWRLDRVRGWDGRPVLLTMSWLHPRLGLKGNEDTGQPLYEMIEKTSGVRPNHAREDFLAVNAETQMARQLDVEKGSPLLLRRHTVFDAGNRPFEYAEVRYVSSRFTLTLDVRRKD
ncbi:MAG TPA: GntR family transcriptional regulator [Verrucomicrobiae bacterium]|jgi:GntR family transcriptional regulator